MLTGYARVSAKDQDLAIQMAELKAAGCERIFCEQISGIKESADRPELDALLKFVREGDVVVASYVDRIARSAHDFCCTIKTLQQKGVDLRLLHQPVDTTTPMGRAVAQILSVMAELDYHMRRERQFAGILAARAANSYDKCGRPRTVDAAAIRIAASEPGKPGTGALARRFKVSRSSIYRALRGEAPAAQSESQNPQITSN